MKILNKRLHDFATRDYKAYIEENPRAISQGWENVIIMMIAQIADENIANIYYSEF